jgi:phage replication-related protein YjqB (UPF0714/DUF867 family)
MNERVETCLPAQSRQGDVARQTLRTNPVEVTATGHLTELLYDDGENDDLLVCAGHGGAVEPGTAEQAIELATALDATAWATLGFDGDVGAFEAFHLPASAVGTETYDLLGTIASRGFASVVSLHGLAEDEVLVGGGLPENTKATVRDRLDAALSVPVSVASATGAYAGTSDANFVNWLAANGSGLQLEQGDTARRLESDAVAATLESLLADGTI